MILVFKLQLFVTSPGSFRFHSGGDKERNELFGSFAEAKDGLGPASDRPRTGPGRQDRLGGQNLDLAPPLTTSASCSHANISYYVTTCWPSERSILSAFTNAVCGVSLNNNNTNEGENNAAHSCACVDTSLVQKKLHTGVQNSREATIAASNMPEHIEFSARNSIFCPFIALFDFPKHHELALKISERDKKTFWYVYLYGSRRGGGRL